jgi:hypothetical protein
MLEGKLYDCAICVEEKGLNDIVVLSCSHIFCVDCMQQHVRVGMNDGRCVSWHVVPSTRLTRRDVADAFLAAAFCRSTTLSCPETGCRQKLVPDEVFLILGTKYASDNARYVRQRDARGVE